MQAVDRIEESTTFFVIIVKILLMLDKDQRPAQVEINSTSSKTLWITPSEDGKVFESIESRVEQVLE